ncbi:peroxisomal succinyl-coenzyme A thioesterase isoform X2 [Etheostoma spectabile]|nr:peroxisomal succinyl-coenzyme A thioesterase-like isoform X2 [Etheostoma spectabile]XP_032361547.1 peroxisomal succinyl-coenzyme A thioesterase-like isoform X2 [Etheostoma spectabile]
MGLLWSMRPVPGSRKGLRLRKMNVCTPLLVNISVYGGHLVEGFREQAPLASSLTERWYMAPGLQRIQIREKGVRGTLFIPPGPGPFPGMLDMWGGGGGLVEYRSALLGSHGYASLALEYFAPGEMKSADTEFNYFETAFNIVKDHPQVMPDKVGIFGLSLGAMVTVLLAAKSNVIKPSCCVCVSGTHLYPSGASIKEVHRLLYMKSHKMRLDENNYEIWRDMGLPIPDDLAHKIDVGRINCPIMVVNSYDDQNGPTVEASEDMAQIMRAAGNKHLLTRLYYHGAGHLIEPPYTPHFRATKFVKGTNEKVILLWGGQTKPHSDAQEDSWKKILAFLKQNLYSSPALNAKM